LAAARPPTKKELASIEDDEEVYVKRGATKDSQETSKTGAPQKNIMRGQTGDAVLYTYIYLLLKSERAAHVLL
jgi:23S rRNA maturation mini-RNase III